jgi:hypothetical protein
MKNSKNPGSTKSTKRMTFFPVVVTYGIHLCMVSSTQKTKRKGDWKLLDSSIPVQYSHQTIPFARHNRLLRMEICGNIDDPHGSRLNCYRIFPRHFREGERQAVDLIPHIARN